MWPRRALGRARRALVAASSGIHHLGHSGSAIAAKSSQETSPSHPACSAMMSSCSRVPGVFISVQNKWIFQWAEKMGIAPWAFEKSFRDMTLCRSSIFLRFHCCLGFSYLPWAFFTIRYSLDFQRRLLYLQTKRAPMCHERLQAFPLELWLLFRPCAAYGLVITLPSLMATFSFSRWFMNFT